MGKMEPVASKLQKVWTSDSELLGLAQRLFHRKEEASPELLLYKSYLEIENYNLGATYFVPTDFIADEKVGDGGLKLESTYREVLERTWARMPVFVARGDSVEEALPEG